jgi:hypothetical protein
VWSHQPRFFFHLYDHAVALEPEGNDLAGCGFSEAGTHQEACELACAEVLHGLLGLDHRIEIADAYDAPVATVRFKDIVKLHP